MPGRVRLIYDAAELEHPMVLARRFAAHPHVYAVRLAVAARSLTVCFDPRLLFADLIAGLPTEQSLPAPITLVKTPRLRLTSLVSLATDLVTFNPLGIALVLVRPLLGESTLIS